MSRHDRHDVVVVGARAAGAPTAMLLARAGARVVVLDRAARGTDTVSTHGLMRAGVLQLDRWGVLDQVVAAGTPAIRRTTFRYSDEDPVQISVRPSPGVPALYAPRRHLLDRVLADAAASSGAEVRHGTTVSALLRDDDGRVRGVRTDDGEELAADVVVGADGIGSRVAREVRAPVLRRGRWASAVRYAYVDGLETDGYEWLYGDHAGAGVIPTDDGLSCLFVATSPERMRRLGRELPPDGVVRSLLERAAPGEADRLATARRVSAVHGWGGVRGFVRRSSGPGWALVGDAAYYTDPISTHGITDALRDAELLAGALLEVLSGTGGAATALQRYERRRDALSGPLFAASDEIAAYDWRGSEVQPLLRRLSAAMTDEVELLETLPRPVAAGPRTADVAVAGR